MRTSGLALILTGGLLGISLRAKGQENLEPLEPAAEARLASKSLSAYLPSSLAVVDKMLEFGKVRPNELVYDLGSGDGRIVIMAAQKYGARGVGIELDPRLCQRSLKKIQELGLRHQVKIIEGDFLDEDLSSADVVTVYLDPRALEALRQHLEKYLHHGMRIVICDAEITGWKASSAVTALGEDKKPHKLTLYEIYRPGEWISFSKFSETK